MPANSAIDVQTASASVLRMVQGLHISRAIYVAAKLAIPDLLADGPRTSDDLAHLTQAHPSSLYRILRLLAALDIFEEAQPSCFGLTPLGQQLRTGVPGSVRYWALLTDPLGGLRPFDHILDAVRSGEPALKLAFGMGGFEFLAQHPDEVAAFQAAMSERTAAFAPSVAATYEFAEMRNIVDVGGGHGTLLAAILAARPELRGVLYDLPKVVAGAAVTLQATGAMERCRTVGGDFFLSVPGDADCYILANVLHDWDDARSVAILQNCRRAMHAGGRILVIERMIFDDPAKSLPTLLSDINMLVLTGGQERTGDEYKRLFEGADLRLTRILPVLYPYAIFEGSPA
jgi:SAM-dependent methyltransferase